jgi:thioredoxin-dependent peroxiredoxin
MAKKSNKKKSAPKAAPKSRVKKAVKKAASKKAAKKVASPKAKKAITKKTSKKVAKKTAKKAVKKASKKVTRKVATKKTSKKVVKKAVPKKKTLKTSLSAQVKKTAPKKIVAKKVAVPKKVVKKTSPAPKTEGKFVKHKTHLKAGDKMPFFGGQDQHGNTIASTSFMGKKMVIYFYPKDDTPGCTLEACNLRDNYGQFKSQGYEIIGVSRDPISSHKKFADKYGLPFSLIADEDATIQKLFGAWGKKMFMGKIFDGTNRFTFVTDEKHVITKVIEDVDTKEHTNQIL